MTRQELINQIYKKKSFLCVGLDTDPARIPAHLLDSEDPVYEFNKKIIDATKDFCVAYKPNIAFYESQGIEGWKSLQKTLEYIPENCFTIADAKRGDIGNTSKMYAKTFFNPEASGLDFDSVTVAPYMGHDSVLPFLEFENKWVILLALTSNPGANDFQFFENKNKDLLHQQVLKTAQQWGSKENLMFVVGATQAEKLVEIRKIVPEHFLLIPGVGAQGGSLPEVAKYGLNDDCGLLVNSSRGIIYASAEEDFADVAAEKAKQIQKEMSEFL